MIPTIGDETLLTVLPDGETKESAFDDGPPEEIDPALWQQWKNEEEVRKDPYLRQLLRAREGHNVGLSNGLQAINKYIYGTHMGRYYLMGGESGTGKTTVGDFMYIFNAWSSAKKQGRKIRIYYFSFEIGRTEKLFRWTSYLLFKRWGIRLPSDFLQGRINGMLPDDDVTRKSLWAYGMIQEMLKDVRIADSGLHPTGIFEVVLDDMGHYGKITREQTEEQKKKKHPGYAKAWAPTDPNMLFMVVCDHIALTNSEMGLETKGVMDKLSRYFIILRNLFNCTIVAFQQFSTDLMAAYRDRLGTKNQVDIKPTRLDFGDSKATFRDADVVEGLVKPEVEDYYGYKMKLLYNCYRVLFLMKNRYGQPDKRFSLFVDGITGMVYDLPLPGPDMEEWYNHAKQIDEVCQVFFPKES